MAASLAASTSRTLDPLPGAVLRGWLGTKSLRTARAYANDVEQFRGWVTTGGRSAPATSMPGIAAMRLGECGPERSPASIGRKLTRLARNRRVWVVSRFSS